MMRFMKKDLLSEQSEFQPMYCGFPQVLRFIILVAHKLVDKSFCLKFIVRSIFLPKGEYI